MLLDKPDYRHFSWASFNHVGNMSTSPHSENIIEQLVSTARRSRQAT